MNKWTREITGRLDEEVKDEIAEFQRVLKPQRRGSGKLRFLFTESFLMDEWINSHDLMIITGLKRATVYNGLVALESADEITGQKQNDLAYYESFRGRTDKAAKLLVAIAGARLECPEDEVSLATMTRQSSVDGFYWHRRHDDGYGAYDGPLDVPTIELV